MFINSLSVVINPLYHDCNLLKRQLKHHVALRLLYLCIVITEKQVLQTDEQTKPKNKFINRYNTFCRCLENLKKSQKADPEADFVLEGTVQNFNLAFDISCKVMKDILVKNMGITDFAIGSPREVLKTAYVNGLIDDDEWLVMLKARNQLAHDYDGEYAKEIFDSVNQKFYKSFEKFKNNVAVYYTYDWNENVKF